MKTPTKEQVKHIRKYIFWLINKELPEQAVFNILNEYEKIRGK